MSPNALTTRTWGSRSTPNPPVAPTRVERREGSFASFLARYRLGGLAPAKASGQILAPAWTDPSLSPASSAARGSAQTAGGTSAAGKVEGVSASEGVAPRGRSAPAGASGPLALEDFPRPADDNGRGMHWVPITYTTNEVVDRYVEEAVKMGVKWMVFLNEGTRIGDNDYLVKRLVEEGIMPIMRVYTPEGRPIEGDLEALVRHYRKLGVEYYQLYNEPNLNVENPDGVPNVDRYVDQWLAAARSVVAAGGLPGFGALSPGGNYDDMEFLRRALDAVKARGETRLLDRAWLSLHNYTLNHPLSYNKDSNGYLKFRWYDSVVREKLGRSMPIIGTEGGTFVGAHEDKTFAPITPQQQVDMVLGAYDYVAQRREPYYFAYTYWVIANEAGGGHDRGFSHHALFKPDGVSPVVEALRSTAGA